MIALPYSRTHHICDSKLTRNRQDTDVQVREKTLMREQAYTSDRTLFTPSSAGTTKITARGEGRDLSARRGERSSLTRLSMDPGDHSSLQFSSHPSQSRLGAAQRGRMSAAPRPEGEEDCPAVVEPWQAGLAAPGVTTDKQSEGQTSLLAATALRGLRALPLQGKAGIPGFGHEPTPRHKHNHFVPPAALYSSPRCRRPGCLKLMVTVPWI